MSAPTISATAEAAREQARDDQGRFGVQPALEYAMTAEERAELESRPAQHWDEPEEQAS